MSDTVSSQTSLLLQAVRDVVIERHQNRCFCGFFIHYAKATGSLEEESLTMKLEATLRKSEFLVDLMRNNLGDLRCPETMKV